MLPSAAADPHVEVQFGRWATPASPLLFETRGISLYPGAIACLTRGQVRIRVEAGRTLCVETAGDVSDAELHTWLFGAALGVLSHQRGAVPLHAGALQIGGRAVLLAGLSGTGKSTTTRALLLRGHRLLADDQVIVDPQRLVVHPGFPAMKLWGISAAALGDTVSPNLPVLPSIEKYHVPSSDYFQPEPAELGTIVVLRPDPSIRQPVMERLSAMEAAMVLTRLVYLLPVAVALGRRAEVLRWAAGLSASVPVFRLRRPDNLAGLSALAACVEDTAARCA